MQTVEFGGIVLEEGMIAEYECGESRSYVCVQCDATKGVGR